MVFFHVKSISKYVFLFLLVCLVSTSPLFASQLYYSTFLSGTNGYDEGVGIAIDSAGMIYIGGTAGSSNFPTTVGAYSTALAGSYDDYVCKINPFYSGSSSLLYCTLLGGSGDDYVDNIAIDSSGRVYIVAVSYSSDFPVTSNAYDTVYRGNEKGTFSILNSNGSALIYSTYLGGTSDDIGSNVTVDTAGNAYICGWTSSLDFPITSGAVDSMYHGGYDAYALKINPTLSGKSSLIYSTFLGGSGDDDEGWENYVDLAGNHYIGGYTNSPDFPITSNAYQTTNHGIYNSFISKLNPTGTSLLYSSYIGGSHSDRVAGMTADNSGNAYLIGYTNSSTDFPVTTNAYSTTYHGGNNDTFIAKFNTNASGPSSLVYSTLVGGSGEDDGWGIAVDAAGNAYFEGYTKSTDFPTTPGAFDTTYHGGFDIFVGKLNSSGSGLAYSSFLGGEGDDEAYTITVDSSGNVYLTGYSYSTDYPITSNAYQKTNNGNTNYVSIITKLATIPPSMSSLPAVKMFLNEALTTAFNLADFNTDHSADQFTFYNNFFGLGLLTGSTVGQSSYDTATVGTNIFLVGNQYISGTVSNEVKYSSYKIQELPKLGLNPGNVYYMNLNYYTLSNGAPLPPPSFGNASSLIVSDTTQIQATWFNTSVLSITALPGFTGTPPVSVDVIASSSSTPPYDDIDKERILIYPNLLTHSGFTSANATTRWSPLEIPPGRTVMASQSIISSYTDSAGTKDNNGVWRFTFSSSSDGVKGTPEVGMWIPMTSGQWYILKMHIVADTPNNSHQSDLFAYNNYVGAGLQTDIAANVLFSIPTVWTWQEIPILVHGTTTTGYPQFQLKAGGPGNVYIDKFIIINAPPVLVDSNRYPTRFHYPYGEFTTGSDTTGWGQQLYPGSGNYPGINFTSGQLQFNFAGAGSGSNQKGIKWTANNNVQGTGHAYTIPANVSHQVGVRATVNIVSGSFNSLGVILLAAYGVQTSGQQDIAVTPSNLVASAGIGILPGGEYRAISVAVNPFYQLQFGLRSDQAGILSVSTVDMDINNDDPNYGDVALFL